jgi:hypothetical protein
MGAPLQAYGAPRNSRADGARKVVDIAAREGRYGPACGASPQNSREVRNNCVDFDQVVVKLQPCNIPIPLGWSLSDATRADIARQLGLIKSDPKDLAWWSDAKCMDPIAAGNREGLEKLMRLAAGASS